MLWDMWGKKEFFGMLWNNNIKILLLKFKISKYLKYVTLQSNSKFTLFVFK